MATAPFTRIESVAVAVLPTESVTVTPKLVVPATVGLPVMAPLLLSEIPVGRLEPLLSAHV